MKKFTLVFALAAMLISCSQQNKQTEAKNNSQVAKSEWIPLFNGKNLDNWFVRGKAKWDVRDGIMTGKGGMGHIYTNAVATDFVVKGTFKISDNGNSGLYFRANPPKDNPDGWPVGYEAQIDNHQDAHTGWLWKPGKPTAKAKALITKDNEWFTMKVKMVGDKMEIWVNGQLMTEYTDSDYKKGHFAIQGHNPGQTIEIKELAYKDLSKK
ncbi:hypothetical protein MNBD_IGNAVI01-502 [hydrothermal vent metagenome]|uniref:3-keto-alpha-glucoside-1,2-lyase/3-keto-2-hydroxy-glucal hydratase domain-containing protein n=1 Tax=hydrothermal vent metagenome TaxID=652676 RepID=A0A3B1CV65_9ZZZZ